MAKEAFILTYGKPSDSSNALIVQTPNIIEEVNSKLSLLIRTVK